MKRIIALLLCISMMVALTACGGNDIADGNSQKDTDTEYVDDNTENNDNIGEPADTGYYARDYGNLTYQETYTSMSEEDFNTAVDNSLICVYTNGGGEFKFYLDYDLNVVALHCADWRAVAVMDNLEYIDMNMPFSKAVQEVYLRMYDIFPPDDWNVPMDIEVTCGFASEGMNKIHDPIIDAVLYITNELCIFPQTNFYFE